MAESVSGICINPYAAGGYIIRPIQNYAKTWKND